MAVPDRDAGARVSRAGDEEPGAASSARDVRGALGGSRLDRRPELAAELATLREALARPGPRLLEIGFDHGRRLSATAAASPAWTVVGLEVRERRVAEARTRAREHGLDNLVPLRLDARAILASPAVIPPGTFQVIEALFPTPWPPEGKPGRRLLATPELFADAARALAPGGLLYVATDVPWLADALRAAAAATPALTPVPWEAGLARRPPCAQRSRREWRCEQDGLPVHRLTFVR